MSILAGKEHDQMQIRFAALLSFVVVVGAAIFIPARVGTMGWRPPDDTLRHTAKAISGKAWDDILVIRDNVTTDSHAGWHAILGFLHHKMGIRKFGLVAFSIALCFFSIAIIPIFFLRRPEAWPLTISLLTCFSPHWVLRLFLGRPYLLTMTVFVAVCLSWESFAERNKPWKAMLLLTAAIAVTTWIQPASYLYGLPIVCFAIARQWRAVARIAVCVVLGSILGLLMTGHAAETIQRTFYVVLRSPTQTMLSRMLVTELQPMRGSALHVFTIGAVLLLWRAVRGRWHKWVVDNPVFYIAIAGFVLGYYVGRFWLDWGLLAALVWIVREIDEILDEYLTFNSWRRFGLSAAIAGSFFLIVTSDVHSRWTFDIPRYPLVYEEASDASKEWFPDSGGILYADDMGIFYRTFYNNPHAPWRYVLGFEPELMRPDDLSTYRNIQWTRRAKGSFQPWISKMRPQDILAITTSGKPRIDGLEWRHMTRGVWFGRVPPDSATDSMEIRGESAKALPGG
ncbi:MAG: hypothetical protein GF418_16655 [Chitinivibrionales bacterium]|nr:hypothetical protein [Chitinivibrionales bacterium]MBD3397253.1 hypothetical protein [Chitinivibrionales bacterium]